MTTIGELKNTVNQYTEIWSDYADVYIALSIEDLEKILEALKKDYAGTKCINVNIKFDPHRMNSSEFFIFPDLDEETHLWQ